jgi:hypothetical protein
MLTMMLLGGKRLDLGLFHEKCGTEGVLSAMAGASTFPDAASATSRPGQSLLSMPIRSRLANPPNSSPWWQLRGSGHVPPPADGGRRLTAMIRGAGKRRIWPISISAEFDPEAADDVHRDEEVERVVEQEFKTMLEVEGARVLVDGIDHDRVNADLIGHAERAAKRIREQDGPVLCLERIGRPLICR